MGCIELKHYFCKVVFALDEVYYTPKIMEIRTCIQVYKKHFPRNKPAKEREKQNFPVGQLRLQTAWGYITEDGFSSVGASEFGNLLETLSFLLNPFLNCTRSLLAMSSPV